MLIKITPVLRGELTGSARGISKHYAVERHYDRVPCQVAGELVKWRSPTNVEGERWCALVTSPPLLNFGHGDSEVFLYPGDVGSDSYFAA